MDEMEYFKVLWTTKKGVIKTFVFDSYIDDPQNKRYIFTNEELLKVLTINYDSFDYMITAPYKPIED